MTHLVVHPSCLSLLLPPLPALSLKLLLQPGQLLLEGLDFCCCGRVRC
jgi:hypothetical protein